MSSVSASSRAIGSPVSHTSKDEGSFMGGSDNYDEKEAKARFEAALKSAMNTPHKPLKEKPKVKKAAKKKKAKP